MAPPPPLPNVLAAGVSESSVTSASSNLKPMDAPNQKITGAVPNSPSSNVSSTAAPSNVSNASSESKSPTMPGKVPGAASKSFPLQFGSISPGFMNGMQIPARTGSAPPNLDEQKKDQVTVKSPVVSHMEKEPLPPSGSLSVGKAEASNVVKRDAPRGKKKKKESYRKAKAADTSSDLYMAYMGSEKKKEIVTASEGSENSSSIIEKQTSAEVSQENAAVCDKPVKSDVPRGKKKKKELYRKAKDAGTSSDLYMAYKGPEEKKEIVTTAEEPDGWEDATEVSTPQLGTSRNENQDNDNGNGLRTKRYSRDSLLKFVGQCPDRPERFEITSFLADALVVSGVNISHESYSCPGHNIEGPEKKKEIVTTSEGSENSSRIIEKQTSAEVSRENAAVCEKIVKSAVPRGKKKREELYRKVEAAGTSLDLYMAYKGPEEKREIVTTAEVPDDWEDAAEVSTPQLGTSRNENQNNDDGYGLRTKSFKKYNSNAAVGQPSAGSWNVDSSDSSAVRAVQNGAHQQQPTHGVSESSVTSASSNLKPMDAPNQKITGAVPNSPSSNVSSTAAPSNVSNASMGMNITPQFPQQPAEKYGGSHKWSKFPRPLMPRRGDMWTDVGYMSNSVGFQPGQGGNYGVLRNPWGQTPGQYAEGILFGPMQSLGPRGGLQISNSDSDRWQRGTGFQKGLMPSPQTPMQVMHKAEKKYEVGKVTDEEETKQRQLKAILNKLTPQNFEKLFQQVKQVNIDNVITLCGVVSQIFDKALMVPTFCEMYANCCFHLAAYLPAVSVDNERITFKRLLLNKCQEEFERGEREEEEADEAEEKGEVKQPAEEREEKKLRARRRILGNIRLIGELFKKRMLTERIMHECINKLFGQYQNPDEGNIEALCILMSIIGEMVDHPKAKEHMDAYYDVMAQLSNNMKLSSRVRFMLKDAINLRKNKWQLRRKVEGPKRIDPAWVILLVGVLLWILVIGNCLILLSRTTE